MRDAAETLARYRVASLAVLRQTDRASRTMFVRDLREGDRRAFPQMQLLLQIVGHFSPHQLRNRPNAKNPSYEEVVSLARMATFDVDFSRLPGLLEPYQDMANAIRLELARGGARYRPIRLLSPPRLRTRLGRLLRLIIRPLSASGGVTLALQSASYPHKLCRFKPGCSIRCAFF